MKIYKVNVWNESEKPSVPFQQIFEDKVDLMAFIDICVMGCKSVGFTVETMIGWDDDDDDF